MEGLSGEPAVLEAFFTWVAHATGLVFEFAFYGFFILLGVGFVVYWGLTILGFVIRFCWGLGLLLAARFRGPRG